MTTRTATIKDLDGILAADHLARKEKLKAFVERGECHVAEDRGQIVGFAALNYNFFDNGFVELLVARENARRRGVATALLAHLRRVCKTRKLFTSTNESNAPMRALLEKSGYTYCGRVYALDEGDPELFFINQPRQ